MYVLKKEISRRKSGLQKNKKKELLFFLFLVPLVYSTIYYKYRATNFANGLGNSVTVYL